MKVRGTEAGGEAGREQRLPRGSVRLTLRCHCVEGNSGFEVSEELPDTSKSLLPLSL